MLTIGIDFDNTIVDYNAAFYNLACEKKIIPNTILPNKLHIRNYLRDLGKENIWTEMQGIIYGSRMDQACAYPGAIAFINNMLNHGHYVVIISHKTRYPYLGEPFDLHQAATMWLNKNIILPSKNIFFELTKKDKINRIRQCQCDLFIDDLPEVFEDNLFPKTTQKILFDSDGYHKNFNQPNSVICRSWDEVSQCVNP